MAAPFDTTTPVTNALANNKMGPIGAFLFRTFYKDKGMPGNQFLPTPIDIWYDKPFFGRVDQNGVAIYPSETNFKQLPGEAPATFWALDFVSDAFSDFQAHMGQAVELGLICGEGDSNITKLEPMRAWADIHDNYNSYSEGIYNILVTDWFQKQQRNSKIKNFSDFLHEFMEFVDWGAPSFPITKSGFILSRFFTPLSSGLIVEISDDDHSEDVVKQEAWIRDPNFTFYIKAARNFGFVIDKNAPWRLCADINNPIMKGYMKPYGLESSDDLFEKYYYKCHFYDIETLKIYLVEMYNAYVLAYPHAKVFRTKLKGAGGIKTVSKKISRRTTSLIDVNREYGPEFWLKTYYYIRLREMGVPRDPVEFNKSLKRILQRHKMLDFESALSYINDMIRRISLQRSK